MWAEKAELALSKGRDDLAKAALVEKQKMNGNAAELQVEVDLLDDQLASYEGDIQKLESKLREARSRQTALLRRLETATNRVNIKSLLRGPKTEEAFSRFEVLERRVDYAEGRADAFDLGEVKSLEQQISDLRTDDAVEAELAAMKNRLASKQEG
jgi:phage shock protein A